MFSHRSPEGVDVGEGRHRGDMPLCSKCFDFYVILCCSIGDFQCCVVSGVEQNDSIKHISSLNPFPIQVIAGYGAEVPVLNSRSSLVWMLEKVPQG